MLFGGSLVIAGPLAYTGLMHGKAASTNWRRHATLLAVLALSLRILIPSGWMPAADRIGLMPCFGAAPAATAPGKMAHHAAPHRESHDKSDRGDKPCAFAGFACALAEPDGTASGAAVLHVAQSLPTIVAPPVTVGAGLAAPPPPPTGPPTIA